MSVGRRRFRIIKEIAEGGFGKVYLAEQISSDGFSRIVAVKLLHAKWSSHDEVVMRTRDEARLLGLIRHQHIVKVEDLTAIDGKCAIVMEYLEGVDLKWMISYLKDRGEIFPRAALFEIILAVASALDAAYNGTPLQGGDPLRVIHRDIKPSNVFATTSGAVKVLDFGTARANFAEREAKTQALAFGSQGYMAPERMLGEEDTPAADVFSLGITLYELLALESFGRIPPRPNKFAAKVQERVASFPLDGPPEWCDQVRETLQLMLSYQPDDRPSAAQLVEIMELLIQDATNMGLRRFCRTVVGEAQEALPELDTGDPLAGTIVDEDASTSFSVDDSGDEAAPQDAASSAGPPPVPAGLGSSALLMTPASGERVALSSPPAESSGASPSAVPAPTEDSISLVTDLDSPGGGGAGRLIVMALLVLAVLLIGGVVGLGGIAFVVTGGATDVVEVPASPGTEEGVADAPAGDAPQEAGGRVISPDAREGVTRVPTTLSFGDPAGGTVVIKGGGGFQAEWDGMADFDLGELAEGRYSTIIEPTGGKKIRGKSFTVDGSRAACAFTFDLAASDWTGGCD